MNFIVCMKRVPDTTARIKVAADGKSMDPQGVEFVINPYDEIAIEEALKLKEKSGAGEVILVSVDPEGNETAMRKGLAMGADRGVLIKGGKNFDGYVTAAILAETLKGLPHDIIFFGKQAIDDDSYQVPSIVAHLLGLPRANVCTKLEVNGNQVKAHREIDGGEDVYEFATPCIISCQKGLNEPRYPSLKGIMASKKKTIEVREAPAMEPTVEVIAMEPPPARPSGKIVGQGAAAVPELVRLLREEAKVL